MMGLTFLIGFFVAAVIKGIALATDSMDFYSSHLLELQRLRRIKKRAPVSPNWYGTRLPRKWKLWETAAKTGTGA